MHPILFKFPQNFPLIGGRGVHVYGVMIALGFLFGMWWVKREAKRQGLDVPRTLDLFFYVVVAGLVGSRILYVIHSVNDFWSDPLVLFRVWEGGLVFQGGVIGSLIVMIWYMRRHRMPMLRTMDVFSPPLSLGHGIGRIGCFFAGCCYGKQCPIDFPLALIFPDVEGGVAPPGIPLYPTQLMESLGEVVLFTFLVFFRKRKPFNGSVTLLYLTLYSLLRAGMELLRGDVIRGFVVEPYLSNAQFISLITVGVCAFLWVYLAKRARLAK